MLYTWCFTYHNHDNSCILSLKTGHDKVTGLLIVLQDLNSVHNSADEMEMYAAVNRKFHAIFNRQEIMKTFKTYDRLEVKLILF